MIRLLGFGAWAAFLGLWLLVARTDWQHKKIRRVHLFYGAGAAALGYLLLVGVTLLGISGRVTEFYYWSFYLAAATHAFLCVFAAMLLWTLRVWPAGDAKLFVLLSAFYPLIEGSFAPERLFLVVLVNTFIPAAVFLFLSAAWYVFDTRLRSGRQFFVNLGWRRELEYLLALLRDRLRGAAADARGAFERVRALPWEERLATCREYAVKLAPSVGQWLIGIVFMSLLSYALKDLLRNPILLSVVCMAIFMLWGQIRRALGDVGSRVLVVALAGALFVWKPFDWTLMGKIMGNVTVFSFFMFLGMNSAIRVVAGGWAALGSFLLPLVFSFVFMFLGWLAGRVGQLVHSVWVWATFQLRDAAAATQGLRPTLLEALHAPLRTARPALSLFGTYSPYVTTLLVLAGLGAFFGLCLVLVRLWEDEVRPVQKRADLAPNLVLAETFIEKLREDAQFYDEHFQRLYADGLTLEQAEALKLWCAEKGIEDVPVATTVSFASWIFLGTFLSLILRGGQLLQAVF